MSVGAAAGTANAHRPGETLGLSNRPDALNIATKATGASSNIAMRPEAGKAPPTTAVSTRAASKWQSTKRPTTVKACPMPLSAWSLPVLWDNHMVRRRGTNRQAKATNSPHTKAGVEMGKGDVVNRSPPAGRHKPTFSERPPVGPQTAKF